MTWGVGKTNLADLILVLDFCDFLRCPLRTTTMLYFIISHQCCICLHSSSNISGATHERHIRSPKSYELYPSHDALIPIDSNEAHLPTPRYGQYLTHTHNHITRAVAAMDSCFALVGAHQHGIAVTRCTAGPNIVRRYGIASVCTPLGTLRPTTAMSMIMKTSLKKGLRILLNFFRGYLNSPC